jgi:Glycosyltransferase family 87
MRPFTWFDRSTAFAIWVSGWIASVGLAFTLTYRTLGVRISASTAALTVLAALMSAPTAAVLTTGQLSPLLVLPFTWAWVQARRGRWERAAIAVGAVASLKLFVGLFLPYLLVQKRWRAAAAFSVAMVVPCAVGLAVFGWASGWSYLTMLRSVTWAGNVMNGSIFGLWERVVRGSAGQWALAPLTSAGQLPIALLWLIFAIPVVAITVWTVRAGERPRDVDRAFLLVTTGALLASPLGWSYYYLLFAGPLIAVAVAGRHHLSGKARALLAVAVPGLLCPPAMLDGGQPSGLATITIGSLYFWSLAAIWAAAVISPSR